MITATCRWDKDEQLKYTLALSRFKSKWKQKYSLDLIYTPDILFYFLSGLISQVNWQIVILDDGSQQRYNKNTWRLFIKMYFTSFDRLRQKQKICLFLVSYLILSSQPFSADCPLPNLPPFWRYFWWYCTVQKLVNSMNPKLYARLCTQIFVLLRKTFATSLAEVFTSLQWP